MAKMANMDDHRVAFQEQEQRLKRAQISEFTRLKDVTYLDHAGATLYSEQHIKDYTIALTNNLYGNPHSSSSSSQSASDAVEEARHRVLRWLNTSKEEYSVIFTSGCTSALKQLVECFSFSEPHETASVIRPHESCDLSETASVIRPEESSMISTTPIQEDTCFVNVNSDKCKEPRGHFVFTEDCHTSVLGLKEIAKSKGAVVKCLPYSVTKSSLPNSDASARSLLDIAPDYFSMSHGRGLFVYPAQSNFNGTKYPLEWIPQVQGHLGGECQGQPCWFVLLDAASFLSSSALDLSKFQPDFISLSFYKIFGFPTGLGALVVRNSRVEVLNKAYFGGGTVQIATRLAHVPKADISDRFEDGTIAYLDIMALNSGFESWNRISGGITNITTHTFALARYVYIHLKHFRHGNGLPVASLYEDTGYVAMATQGPIIAFNLLRPDGAYLGCSQVEKLAHACNIHWRVGCFCNMGACQAQLGLSDEQIMSNFEAGHVCGDDMDVIDGRPTGAIRVSLGYTSTLEDANALLDFIKTNYVNDIENVPPINSEDILNRILRDIRYECKINYSSANKLSMDTNDKSIEKNVDQEKPDKCERESCAHELMTGNLVGRKKMESQRKIANEDPIFVKAICLYPVKSCAAFKVPQWPLCERGLLYDRLWMIISSGGAPLTQSRVPQMCLIRPFINKDMQTLTLKFDGLADICVPLDMASRETKDISVCQQKLCGDWVSVADCGDEVASWLEEALYRPGVRLVRQLPDSMRTSQAPTGVAQGASLSLVNRGQYLLVNEESVKHLQGHILDTAVLQSEENHLPMENLVDRFRGNIVISAKPHRIEESWSHLQIGDIEFFTTSTCIRCQMVCVDQTDGSKGRQPLTAINATRGKLEFGILLQHHLDNQMEAPTLSVGDQLLVMRTNQDC